jgi:threonine dehydrogenase-like Zn-dependent dehydrogenase
LLSALGPVVNREIVVTGSNCYAVTEGKADFEWAIDLIRTGAVNASGLVTHTFPLHRIDEAFRTANDKSTGSIKVAVRIPG